MSQSISELKTHIKELRETKNTAITGVRSGRAKAALEEKFRKDRDRITTEFLMEQNLNTLENW